MVDIHLLLYLLLLLLLAVVVLVIILLLLLIFLLLVVVVPRLKTPTQWTLLLELRLVLLLWHYQVVLTWYLHQPESYQLSLHKC